MKKNIIIPTLSIFLFLSIASCKKAYKCKCDQTDPTTGRQYVVENPYLDKMSKSEADAEKTKCETQPGCSFVRDKK